MLLLPSAQTAVVVTDSGHTLTRYVLTVTVDDGDDTRRRDTIELDVVCNQKGIIALVGEALACGIGCGYAQLETTGLVLVSPDGVSTPDIGGNCFAQCAMRV